ncbi:uncharacterized membrane protein HdeD (DUF308 family) [Salana multivorans]|uniref:Uncharacterized membrane protein HdeD (DUF308 family) n=1 Tax=Salana multivorans TaxID=120377 RepID=A0A3N2D9W9_9MICO|nr:DUF308 domain-containing protein [Salana multivorans]MBN8882130.1 DUF308 domain-containing protein [Salana multivorans]OJX95445.1 MAG: hypothetical protein BGO96_11520 [Micrococcales bacterium 73-15]ROR96513.1 uncharacterized membrane protein HdeD (DUF308 family) [Salana multivorans]
MTEVTTPKDLNDGVTGAFRIAFGLAGLITLIVGILVLIWPGKTAVVVTALLAVYAIVLGIVYAAVGVFGSGKTGWSRIGHIVAGLVFVVAGIVAFGNLRAVTAGLAVIVTIFIGAAWLVEGIAALATLGRSQSKGWTVFYAIVSVLAGITLMFSPLFSAVVLWWFVGISLVVLGAIQIGRAFSFGRGLGA